MSKRANLECAFAMFAAYYNFCCQTSKPGKIGQVRTAASMASGLADKAWSMRELVECAGQS